MTTQDYQALDTELRALLTLQAPPLAITFSAEAPSDVPPYEGAMPAPTPDGRTGKVSAGCVFWMKAEVDNGSLRCSAQHEVPIVKLV